MERSSHVHRADSWSLARRRGCSRGGLQRRSRQDWPRERPRRRSSTALLLSFYAYRLVRKQMPSPSEPSIKVLARHCVTCQGMTDGFETRGKEEWRPL